METIKEISVFLENKPGRLSNVCSALAARKVNITAMTIGNSRDRSVLRLVTDNPPATRDVLKAINVPCQEHEVVVVEMRNQPGALAQVCEQLAHEHVNIEHAYCSSGTRNGKTVGIFKVSNAPKAMRVLAESPGNRARRENIRRPVSTFRAR